LIYLRPITDNGRDTSPAHPGNLNQAEALYLNTAIILGLAAFT